MYNRTRDYRKAKEGAKILEYNRITMIDIDGVLFFDPPLDSMLKMSPSKVVNELENLVLHNQYLKEESERIYCDDCLSTDIKKEYLCPRCQSLRIYKDVILLHVCGFRGTRKAFQYIDYMRCPHCKKRLIREDDDYIVEGVKYKCVDCTNIFEEPLIKFKCRSCGRILGDDPKKIKVTKYIRNL